MVERKDRARRDGKTTVSTQTDRGQGPGLPSLRLLILNDFSKEITRRALRPDGPVPPASEIKNCEPHGQRRNATWSLVHEATL